MICATSNTAQFRIHITITPFYITAYYIQAHSIYNINGMSYCSFQGSVKQKVKFMGFNINLHSAVLLLHVDEPMLRDKYGILSFD
jgi:hypothetical protein